MFRYDMMTAASVELNGRELENEAGEVDALRVSVSRTTLAYMEDTGFYTANYDLAGFQKWGWQEGCSFALQDCGDWAKENPGQTHFCKNPTLAAASLDVTDLEVRSARKSPRSTLTDGVVNICLTADSY
jgi:hypothetical protein